MRVKADLISVSDNISSHPSHRCGLLDCVIWNFEIDEGGIPSLEADHVLLLDCSNPPCECLIK